jgi:hypothetical protein
MRVMRVMRNGVDLIDFDVILKNWTGSFCLGNYSDRIFFTLDDLVAESSYIHRNNYLFMSSIVEYIYYIT